MEDRDMQARIAGSLLTLIPMPAAAAPQVVEAPATDTAPAATAPQVVEAPATDTAPAATAPQVVEVHGDLSVVTAEPAANPVRQATNPHYGETFVTAPQEGNSVASESGLRADDGSATQEAAPTPHGSAADEQEFTHATQPNVHPAPQSENAATVPASVKQEPARNVAAESVEAPSSEDEAVDAEQEPESVVLEMPANPWATVDAAAYENFDLPANFDPAAYLATGDSGMGGELLPDAPPSDQRGWGKGSARVDAATAREMMLALKDLKGN